MAHQMFNINAQAKKYPLFDKALEDAYPGLEGALFWSIGETGLLGLPKKIITIVEKGIDGTDAEKEAIMIGTLARMAPFFTDIKLSAEATDVMQQLVAHTSGAVMAEKVAQVETVMNVALQTSMLPTARAGGVRLNAGQIAEVNKAIAEQEKLILPNLNAPKLLDSYTKTKKAMLDAAVGKTAAPKHP